MPMVRYLRGLFALPSLVFMLGGCAGPGQYVWYVDLPAQATQRTEYVINFGDTLSVRVYGHEDMTVRERVRADGRIAIPLLGDMEVQGRRPDVLRGELQARLKEFVVNPSVTVAVDEWQPMTIGVIGEVARPGTYPMDANAGLGQALAAGGGVTDFASRDRVFIVRQQPAPLRIRFTYQAISRNDRNAAAFPLHPGDLVVVE